MLNLMFVVFVFHLSKFASGIKKIVSVPTYVGGTQLNPSDALRLEEATSLGLTNQNILELQ